MDDSKHNESKLPLWAQERLHSLRCEIQRLKNVEVAHDILIGRDWFTIRGPTEKEKYPDDVRHLWWLSADRPFPACSIHYGDILLIGRSRHRHGGKPVPVNLNGVYLPNDSLSKEAKV